MASSLRSRCCTAPLLGLVGCSQRCRAAINAFASIIRDHCPVVVASIRIGSVLCLDAFTVSMPNLLPSYPARHILDDLVVRCGQCHLVRAVRGWLCDFYLQTVLIDPVPCTVDLESLFFMLSSFFFDE